MAASTSPDSPRGDLTGHMPETLEPRRTHISPAPAGTYTYPSEAQQSSRGNGGASENLTASQGGGARSSMVGATADVGGEDEVHELVGGEADEKTKKILMATVGRGIKKDHQKEVMREDLVDYIKEEIHRTSVCLHFPLTLLYFIVFTLCVLMHEDLQNSAQMERMLQQMVAGAQYEGLSDEFPVSGHKVLEDVDSVEEAWGYLNEGLMEAFIPELGVPPEDVNRVIRYNQLIGGVQMQQIRRREENCAEAYPTLGPFSTDGVNPLLNTISCYPRGTFQIGCYGIGNESDGTEGFCPDSVVRAKYPKEARRRLTAKNLQSTEIGRRLFSESHADGVRGRYKDALSGGRFEGGVYTVTLQQYDGLEAAMDKMAELEEEGWLDDATAWFGVKVLMLNPDLAIYIHVIVNMWFSPSGQTLAKMTVSSFPAEPYQSQSNMALDVVFGLLWFYLFVCCVVGLMRAAFFNAMHQYIRSVWSWLDWLSMLGGLAMIGGWALFISSLGSIQNAAMQVVEHEPLVDDNYQFVSEAQKGVYLRAGATLHDEVSALSAFLVNYRVFICWYSILIIGRFFQAFEAQPRLAIVTHTVSRSLNDIGHFLIVLTVVFVAYAIAGQFLFGHRLLEFSEFIMAINTLFCMMLGGFDFPLIAGEHPAMAAFWFWTFVVSVSIILLNMALAIVMDVHSEVVSDAAVTEELWTQAGRVAKSAWTHRDWVTPREILADVQKLPEDVDRFTQDSLIQAIPDVTQPQAAYLIREVEKHKAHQDFKGLTLSDAMRMIGSIKFDTQRIANRVERIHIMQNENRRQLKEYLANYDIENSGRPIQYIEFDEPTDLRLQVMEKRLQGLEDSVNEAMSATVVRAKEMRNVVTVVEDLLNSTKGGGGGSASRGGRSEPASLAGLRAKRGTTSNQTFMA